MKYHTVECVLDVVQGMENFSYNYDIAMTAMIESPIIDRAKRGMLNSGSATV